MLRFVKMLGGMPALRGIAAAHIATGETHAQRHPAIAAFTALLTFPRTGLYVSNLIKVRALFSHIFSFNSPRKATVGPASNDISSERLPPDSLPMTAIC